MTSMTTPIPVIVDRVESEVSNLRLTILILLDVIGVFAHVLVRRTVHLHRLYVSL